MSEYLYLIHPFREKFFNEPSPAEEKAMAEHFEYLKRGVEEGIVVLAGPCLDDTFGVVIFRAENETAAQAFMFADPSVKANIMLAELHPMRISLLGK